MGFKVVSGDVSNKQDSSDIDSRVVNYQNIMALENEFGIEFPDEAIPELLSFVAIQEKISALT